MASAVRISAPVGASTRIGALLFMYILYPNHLTRSLAYLTLDTNYLMLYASF